MRTILLAGALLVGSTDLFAAPLSFRDLRNPEADHPIHSESDFTASMLDLSSDDEWHPSPIERPSHLRIHHYDLKVKVNPSIGTVQGTVEIQGTSVKNALKQLAIDAVDMTFSSVKVNGEQPKATHYNGSLLLIDLNQPLAKEAAANIEIAFQALHPQRLRVTGPDVSNPQRMIAAYTYTQPLGTRHWFPCVDRPSEKATLSIEVTVPEGFNALSNGHALPQTAETTFAYRMEQPVATYLISLAIGNYEIHDMGSVGETKLSLWTPTAIRDHALREAEKTDLMMRVFETFTGTKYPFGTYTQSVAQAWGSSMEHQSVTTMGGMRMTGDGSGEGVVAHELAHQWFGDHVTCETWEELWLNEGFASYLPMLFFQANQDTSGEFGYRDYWREGYFEEAKTFVRPLAATAVNHGDIFDAHAYQKGALIIHLMRSVANEMAIEQGMQPFNGETFTAALATYFRRHGGGNVRNQDLQAALEWVTGKSWQRFFNQWVRSEGHPIVKVTSSVNGNALFLNFEQVQATRSERQWRAFSFPLEIELVFADGTSEFRTIDLFGSSQTVTLDLEKPLLDFAMNPRWIVPMEIVREFSDAEHHIKYIDFSTSDFARLERVRNLALHWKSQDELPAAFLKSIKGIKSDYVLAEALSAIATSKSRISQVEDVFAELIFRNSRDRYVNEVITKTEAWLAIEGGSNVSEEQFEQLKHRYLLSSISNQRKSLMDLMLFADQAKAHAFALERLAEDHWPTRDRRFLVDALSQRVSATSKPFLKDMISTGTLYHKTRVLSNLIEEGGQHPELVEVSVAGLASERYVWAKELLLDWLATQTESKDSICPKVLELIAAGANGNQLGEETFAPISKSLQSAKTSLSCQ